MTPARFAISVVIGHPGGRTAEGEVAAPPVEISLVAEGTVDVELIPDGAEDPAGADHTVSFLRAIDPGEINRQAMARTTWDSEGAATYAEAVIEVLCEAAEGRSA